MLCVTIARIQLQNAPLNSFHHILHIVTNSPFRNLLQNIQLIFKVKINEVLNVLSCVCVCKLQTRRCPVMKSEEIVHKVCCDGDIMIHSSARPKISCDCNRNITKVEDCFLYILKNLCRIFVELPQLSDTVVIRVIIPSYSNSIMCLYMLSINIYSKPFRLLIIGSKSLAFNQTGVFHKREKILS